MNQRITDDEWPINDKARRADLMRTRIFTDVFRHSDFCLHRHSLVLRHFR